MSKMTLQKVHRLLKVFYKASITIFDNFIYEKGCIENERK